MKGGKVSAVDGVDTTGLDLPFDEKRRFIATGGRQTILNYECAAYKSGLVTIWVTGELPSSINPGINNVDVPGAILRFEFGGEKSTLVSKVQVIQRTN